MEQSGLLDVLTRETNEEKEKILSKAQSDAKKIISDAEKEGKRIRDERMSEVTSEMKKEKMKELGKARLRAQELLLRTKESLMERVFNNATEQLEKISTDKNFWKTLEKLIEEALSEFDSKVFIIVSEKDASHVQGIVKNKRWVAEVKGSNEIIGGVKIISEDGKMEVLNTIKSRFEKAKEPLRAEVAKILWS